MNTNVTSLLKKLLVLSLAVATAAPLCAMEGAAGAARVDVGAGVGDGGGAAGVEAGAGVAKVVMNQQLLETAKYGDSAAVIDLINTGADVTCQDSEGRTALHNAAFYGNVEAARVLIEHKANVDAADKYGMTPLHLATMRDDTAVLILLLLAGANVNIKDNLDWTPMHTAAWHGNQKVVEALVLHGADPTVVDMFGCTPAVIARKHEHFYVATLIEYYAARAGRLAGSRQQLYIAVYRLRAAIAKQTRMNLALSQAAGRGDLAAVRDLLLQGADPNFRDDEGWTALHNAAFYGNVSVAEVLIAWGANLDATDHHGATPLHMAARHGHSEVVAVLLANPNVAVNAADYLGQTPLHTAAQYGLREIAQMLIARDAALTAVDAQGDTPADVARNYRHFETENCIRSCYTLRDKYGRATLTLVQNVAAAGVFGLLAVCTCRLMSLYSEY